MYVKKFTLNSSLVLRYYVTQTLTLKRNLVSFFLLVNCNYLLFINFTSTISIYV